MADQKDLGEQGVGAFADVLRGNTPEEQVPADEHVRDLEKSLVERIGDVDDDRRRTAIQLRKALRVHRDEVDAQVKRQGGITIGLLALLAIVFSALLGWISWTANADRAALIRQVAELEARLADLAEASPSAAEAADPSREALADDFRALGGRVTVLTDEVARLTEFRGNTEQRLDALTEIAAAQPTSPALSEPVIPEQVIDEAKLMERLTPLLGALEQLGTEVSDLQAAQRQIMSSSTSRSAADTAVADRLAAIEEALPDLSARVEAVASSTSDIAGRVAVRERYPDRADASAGAGASEKTDDDGASVGASASESQVGTGATAPIGAFLQAAPGERVVTGARSMALQLIAFRSRRTLADFVAQNPLPERFYVREETYQGGPWIVLIHSLHESVDEAEQARAALPESLADLDIWIRPLESGAELEVVAADSPL